MDVGNRAQVESERSGDRWPNFILTIAIKQRAPVDIHSPSSTLRIWNSPGGE